MVGAAVDQISYTDLYKRWERGNWRASEIDFASDRVDWQAKFSDLERRAALWNYAMFFHGEDTVAGDLSPFIDAAPREEQKYFLTTQQVDEARHAVFFNRFMREVVEAGDGTVAGALEATLAQPGQHFISDYLAARDVLPGFRQGMRHVSLDEQRHIGFGVKLLHDLAAEDPDVPDAVADQLREVTPVSLAVFVPPGWDLRYVE